MTTIFDIALSKGKIAKQAMDWPIQLCDGEVYNYINSNDCGAISRHIHQLDSTITELLTVIDDLRNA